MISWNALISGYHHQGFSDETLVIFEQMKWKGFLPNAVTFSCVLESCSSIGFLDLGEEIHREVESQGLLHKDITLGNALVAMYVFKVWCR